MPVKERWQRVVAEISAVATARGRARLGACSLEGTRVFERALRAGAGLEACVITERFAADPDPRIVRLRAGLAAAGCSTSIVPDPVMRELTDGRSIGDIVGLARLPAPVSLEHVLENAGPGPARLLACVGVDDPGNVGALVRTAHASGAAALLAIGATDAFHPRAVRTSMGSVFRLPVLATPDAGLASLVGELRARGVRTLAAESRGGAPLSEVRRTDGAVAVFLGSEAFGLPDEARALVDEGISIPMPDGVDSFSVNAAAAVLLYALAPARDEGGSQE